MTTNTVTIRARLTGRGGHGRKFTATEQQLADARVPDDATRKERAAYVVACRLVVPVDSIFVVEVSGGDDQQ